MTELRRHNLRVAEIADVVQELLSPMASQDKRRIQEAIARVRQEHLSGRTRLRPHRAAEDRDLIPADDHLGQPRAAAPGGRRRARQRATRPPLGVAGDPRGQAPRGKRPEQHRTAWSRVRAELAPAEGTGLISHEFFAAASAEQAPRMVDCARRRRGPRGRHGARAARAVHGQLAGEPQERRDDADGRLRPPGVEAADGHLELADARPAAGARTLVAGGSARADPRRGARPRRTAGGRLAPIRGHSGRRARGDRPVRVLPEHLDGRRRGGDPAPHQRPAAAVSAEAFDKGVYIRTFLADERLVPGAGRQVLARAGPDRGVPPSRASRR